jgi:hypothetical protein
MIEVLKVAYRNRQLLNIIFVIALLSSLIVSFYAVANHFDRISNLADMYYPEKNIYLILNPSKEIYEYLPKESLYVSGSIVDGTVIINGERIRVELSWYRDINIFISILGAQISGDLSQKGILLSRELSQLYNVKIGDRIQVSIEAYTYNMTVVGYINGIFNLLITDEPPPGLQILLIKSPLPETVYKEQGIRVYRIDNIKGYIKDVRTDVITLIHLWSLPIYLIILISCLFTVPRYILSIRPHLNIIHRMGLSIRVIRKYVYLVVISSIIIASFVGISLGIVATQVFSKIIYLFQGITIFPFLTIEQYITVSFLTILASCIGLFISMRWYISETH